MKLESFAVKYAQSMVALIIGLIVIFFSLYMLKLHAPGVIGSTAGTIGARASGQSYTFN